MKKTTIRAAAAGLGCSMIFAALAPAHANGWLESRPWQFQTSADRANNAVVLDLIERKKGGYYDGFSTTVNNYSNTNIGTQVNCSNVAEATGNWASNSQTANSPNVNNSSGVDSSATGNEASNAIDGGGKGSGTSGAGANQDNSGNVGSNVSDSNSSSSSGPINSGTSQLDLDNDQRNSGNQYASVDGTACDMTGSTVKGNVASSIKGPLN